MTQLTFWSLESVPAAGDNAGEMKQTRRLGKGLRALLPVGASDDGAPDRFEGVDRDAASILRLSDADDSGSVASSEHGAEPPAAVAETPAQHVTPDVVVRDEEPGSPAPAAEPAASPQYAFVDDVVLFDPPVGHSPPTPERSAEPTPEPPMPEAGENELEAPTSVELPSSDDAPAPEPEPQVVEPEVVLIDEPLFVDDVITGYFLPEVELE